MSHAINFLDNTCIKCGNQAIEMIDGKGFTVGILSGKDIRKGICRECNEEYLLEWDINSNTCKFIGDSSIESFLEKYNKIKK